MLEFQPDAGSVSVDPKYPMVQRGVLTGSQRIAFPLGAVKCGPVGGRQIEAQPPQTGHFRGVLLEFATRVEKARVTVELSAQDAKRLMEQIADALNSEAPGWKE